MTSDAQKKTALQHARAFVAGYLYALDPSAGSLSDGIPKMAPALHDAGIFVRLVDSTLEPGFLATAENTAIIKLYNAILHALNVLEDPTAEDTTHND